MKSKNEEEKEEWEKREVEDKMTMKKKKEE